jgi:hypothetical protein
VKFRSLVAIPFLALVALWVALALAGDAHRAGVFHVEVEVAKLAALIGCAAAALRFAPGDYLRTAWLLQAQCYLFIILTDVLFRAGIGVWGDRSWAPIAGGLVVLVANIGQLVGTWMLARVWRVAGFDLAGSRAVRIAVLLGVIGVAVAAGAPLSITGFRAVMAGDMAALVDVASTVADVISFSLMGPFLLTAIALRGGSLAWTWGLFTASLGGWLLFDAFGSYGASLSWSPAATETASESCRLLACMFGLSSGLAQRFAVRGLPAD